MSLDSISIGEEGLHWCTLNPIKSHTPIIQGKIKSVMVHLMKTRMHRLVLKTNECPNADEVLKPSPYTSFCTGDWLIDFDFFKDFH